MKEASRHNILSFIAVTSINLFLIPAVFLLRELIFGQSGGIAALLLYFAVSSAGYLAGRMIFKGDAEFFEAASRWPVFKLLFYFFNVKEKGQMLSNMTGSLSVLVPAAIAGVLYGGMGVWRMMFEVFLLVLPYFIALKNSGKSYSDIFYNHIAIFGFIVMAAAIIASNYIAETNYLKWYFYAVLYVYILFYLVLRNQEDIDGNIYSKKYIQKSILPRNMRGFNLIAVLGLYCIILLLFNLKTVVLYLMDIGVKVIAWAAYAIMWLVSLLFPPTGDARQDSAQMPADFGFFGGAEEAVNPFMNLLENTFKAFIILYVLYKLLPFLLKKAVILVKKLAELLKRSFGRHTVAASVDEYNDEVETIKPEKEARRRNLRKSIYEAGRELGKITDPVERVRQMYLILLKLLEAYGVELDKSDTTSEIYNKTKGVENLSVPFHPITSLYNKVRYGGEIPDHKSLTSFEARYNEASGIIREPGRTRRL